MDKKNQIKMQIQQNIMNDSPIPARAMNNGATSGKNSSIPASSLDYYDKPSNEILLTNNNS
jgi:hypothetical protein